MNKFKVGDIIAWEYHDESHEVIRVEENDTYDLRCLEDGHITYNCIVNNGFLDKRSMWNKELKEVINET